MKTPPSRRYPMKTPPSRRYPQMSTKDKESLLAELASALNPKDYREDVLAYLELMQQKDYKAALAMALVAPWDRGSLCSLYTDVSGDVWYMHDPETVRAECASADDTRPDWRFALLMHVQEIKDGLDKHLFCPKCFIPKELQ